MLPVSNTCGRIFHCEAGQEPANSPEALCKTHRAEDAYTEAAERESWSGRACPGWICLHRRQKEKCDRKVLREPHFPPKLRGSLCVTAEPLVQQQALTDPGRVCCTVLSHQGSSCPCSSQSPHTLLTPWGHWHPSIPAGLSSP